MGSRSRESQREGALQDWQALRLDVNFRIIKRCTEWLQLKGRLREEGVFRVSGSVSRIKKLVEELNDEATGGDRRVSLDEQDIHTVCGAMKRTLLDIEPPLLPASTFAALQKAQFDVEEVPKRLEMYSTAIQDVAKGRYDLLRHVFEFLRAVVREHKHNRMDAQNVCKVFSASLMRGEDDLQSSLLLASGRLPSIALVFLISNVLLETSFDPVSFKPITDQQLPHVLAEEDAKLDKGSKGKAQEWIVLNGGQEEGEAAQKHKGRRGSKATAAGAQGGGGGGQGGGDSLFGSLTSFFAWPGEVIGGMLSGSWDPEAEEEVPAPKSRKPPAPNHGEITAPSQGRHDQGEYV